MANEATPIQVTVVTGIIRMVQELHRAKEENRPYSMSEAARIGTTGVTDNMTVVFICEFAKDGIRTLRSEEIKCVVDGNYTALWRWTNAYLKMFGHKPIEPVPISV